MLRRAFVAVSLLWGAGAVCLPASAQQGDEPVVQAADSTLLARSILQQVTLAPTGDKNAVLEAINRATAGFDIGIITTAVCDLNDRRDIARITGADASAQVQARITLGRPEVSQALSETCDVARLALANSGGATGGIGTVPARGGVGRSFGLGVAAGSPGGGGGSGYTPNN